AVSEDKAKESPLRQPGQGHAQHEGNGLQRAALLSGEQQDDDDYLQRNEGATDDEWKQRGNDGAHCVHLLRGTFRMKIVGGYSLTPTGEFSTMEPKRGWAFFDS